MCSIISTNLLNGKTNHCELFLAAILVWYGKKASWKLSSSKDCSLNIWTMKVGAGVQHQAMLSFYHEASYLLHDKKNYRIKEYVSWIRHLLYIWWSNRLFISIGLPASTLFRLFLHAYCIETYPWTLIPSIMPKISCSRLLILASGGVVLLFWHNP